LEHEEGSPTFLTSKKRKKKENKEEENRTEEEEEGSVSVNNVKEKDKTGRDQAEEAAQGRDKPKNKNKTKSQSKRNVKALEGVVEATSGKSVGVKVKENPIGPPHLPNPGDPEAGIGEDGQQKGDVDPCDDVPLLARNPLPAGKTAAKKRQKRLRRKEAGKAERPRLG